MKGQVILTMVLFLLYHNVESKWTKWTVCKSSIDSVPEPHECLETEYFEVAGNSTLEVPLYLHRCLSEKHKVEISLESNRGSLVKTFKPKGLKGWSVFHVPISTHGRQRVRYKVSIKNHAKSCLVSVKQAQIIPKRRKRKTKTIRSKRQIVLVSHNHETVKRNSTIIHMSTTSPSAVNKSVQGGSSPGHTKNKNQPYTRVTCDSLICVCAAGGSTTTTSSSTLKCIDRIKSDVRRTNSETTSVMPFSINQVRLIHVTEPTVNIDKSGLSRSIVRVASDPIIETTDMSAESTDLVISKIRATRLFGIDMNEKKTTADEPTMRMFSGNAETSEVSTAMAESITTLDLPIVPTITQGKLDISSKVSSSKGFDTKDANSSIYRNLKRSTIRAIDFSKAAFKKKLTSTTVAIPTASKTKTFKHVTKYESTSERFKVNSNSPKIKSKTRSISSIITLPTGTRLIGGNLSNSSFTRINSTTETTKLSSTVDTNELTSGSSNSSNIRATTKHSEISKITHKWRSTILKHVTSNKSSGFSTPLVPIISSSRKTDNTIRSIKKSTVKDQDPERNDGFTSNTHIFHIASAKPVTLGNQTLTTLNPGEYSTVTLTPNTSTYNSNTDTPTASTVRSKHTIMSLSSNAKIESHNSPKMTTESIPMTEKSDIITTIIHTNKPSLYGTSTLIKETLKYKFKLTTMPYNFSEYDSLPTTTNIENKMTTNVITDISQNFDFYTYTSTEAISEETVDMSDIKLSANDKEMTILATGTDTTPTTVVTESTKSTFTRKATNTIIPKEVGFSKAGITMGYGNTQTLKQLEKATTLKRDILKSPNTIPVESIGSFRSTTPKFNLSTVHFIQKESKSEDVKMKTTPNNIHFTTSSGVSAITLDAGTVNKMVAVSTKVKYDLEAIKTDSPIGNLKHSTISPRRKQTALNELLHKNTSTLLDVSNEFKTSSTSDLHAGTIQKPTTVVNNAQNERYEEDIKIKTSTLISSTTRNVLMTTDRSRGFHSKSPRITKKRFTYSAEVSNISNNRKKIDLTTGISSLIASTTKSKPTLQTINYKIVSTATTPFSSNGLVGWPKKEPPSITSIQGNVKETLIAPTKANLNSVNPIHLSTESNANINLVESLAVTASLNSTSNETNITNKNSISQMATESVVGSNKTSSTAFPYKSNGSDDKRYSLTTAVSETSTAVSAKKGKFRKINNSKFTNLATTAETSRTSSRNRYNVVPSTRSMKSKIIVLNHPSTSTNLYNTTVTTVSGNPKSTVIPHLFTSATKITSLPTTAIVSSKKPTVFVTNKATDYSSTTMPSDGHTKGFTNFMNGTVYGESTTESFTTPISPYELHLSTATVDLSTIIGITEAPTIDHTRYKPTSEETTINKLDSTTEGTTLPTSTKLDTHEFDEFGTDVSETTTDLLTTDNVTLKGLSSSKASVKNTKSSKFIQEIDNISLYQPTETIHFNELTENSKENEKVSKQSIGTLTTEMEDELITARGKALEYKTQHANRSTSHVLKISNFVTRASVAKSASTVAYITFTIREKKKKSTNSSTTRNTNFRKKQVTTWEKDNVLSTLATDLKRPVFTVEKVSLQKGFMPVTVSTTKIHKSTIATKEENMKSRFAKILFSEKPITKPISSLNSTTEINSTTQSNNNLLNFGRKVTRQKDITIEPYKSSTTSTAYAKASINGTHFNINLLKEIFSTNPTTKSTELQILIKKISVSKMSPTTVNIDSVTSTLVPYINYTMVPKPKKTTISNLNSSLEHVLLLLHNKNVTSATFETLIPKDTNIGIANCSRPATAVTNLDIHKEATESKSTVKPHNDVPISTRNESDAAFRVSPHIFSNYIDTIRTVLVNIKEKLAPVVSPISSVSYGKTSDVNLLNLLDKPYFFFNKTHKPPVRDTEFLIPLTEVTTVTTIKPESISKYKNYSSSIKGGIKGISYLSNFTIPPKTNITNVTTTVNFTNSTTPPLSILKDQPSRTTTDNPRPRHSKGRRVTFALLIVLITSIVIIVFMCILYVQFYIYKN